MIALTVGTLVAPATGVPTPPTAAAPQCEGRPVTILGTEDDDTILGTQHRDVILALDGDDRVDGRGGNDVICGGARRDLLRGGRMRTRCSAAPTDGRRRATTTASASWSATSCRAARATT